MGEDSQEEWQIYYKRNVNKVNSTNLSIHASHCVSSIEISVFTVSEQPCLPILCSDSCRNSVAMIVVTPLLQLP